MHMHATITHMYNAVVTCNVIAITCMILCPITCIYMYIYKLKAPSIKHSQKVGVWPNIKHYKKGGVWLMAKSSPVSMKNI